MLITVTIVTAYEAAIVVAIVDANAASSVVAIPRTATQSPTESKLGGFTFDFVPAISHNSVANTGTKGVNSRGQGTSFC